MDAPSRLVLTATADALQRQVDWFASFQPRFSTWEQTDTTGWCDYVETCLQSVRFIADGFSARRPPLPGGCSRFQGIDQIRRDRTFRVSDKSLLPREGVTFAEQRFLVFYNHTQEMQFPSRWVPSSTRRRKCRGPFITIWHATWPTR